MKCTIVEGLGRCSGVSRSINSSYGNINSSTYMLGKVIRSTVIVNDLIEKGIPVISNLDEVPMCKNTTIIVPTYGMPECIINKINRLGYKILDNTCPRVRRVQKIVADASQKGMDIILVGYKSHPQVKGIIGWIKTKLILIQDMESALRIIPTTSFSKKGVCMVSATEYSQEKYYEISQYCHSHIPNLIVKDTPCKEKENREKRIRELFIDCNADVVIILGEQESSSNAKCYEMAMEQCCRVFLVNSPDALSISMFEDVNKVCIIINHGISRDIIEETIKIIHGYCIDLYKPFTTERTTLQNLLKRKEID